MSCGDVSNVHVLMNAPFEVVLPQFALRCLQCSRSHERTFLKQCCFADLCRVEMCPQCSRSHERTFLSSFFLFCRLVSWEDVFNGGGGGGRPTLDRIHGGGGGGGG